MFKFNITKMKKALYDRVPDFAEREFYKDDPSLDHLMQDFFIEFSRRMQCKHGKRLDSISTYLSENISDKKIRVRTEAKLR